MNAHQLLERIYTVNKFLSTAQDIMEACLNDTILICNYSLVQGRFSFHEYC